MYDVCEVSDSAVARAAQIVRRGGLVVLPTDTVYGIACSPYNRAAMELVYQVKHRRLDKPLQVLVSSVDDLDDLGLYLPAPLDKLAVRFLPGPFSPIAQAQDDCRLATLCQDGQSALLTQGVRIPDSSLSLRILRETGPLACSSANRSGRQSAQTVQEAIDAFGDDVELYLDGGPTQGHVASTVVKADSSRVDGIEIVREGVIDEATVRAALNGNGGGLSR
ncbi:L-threonylcarbamoyladenylate synthase [Bifidobacterium bombi]|uniref:L-threonylcarbamoyladenylate synthase n=1 Tax=Bifidobacterium bombi DSM 19703 TaxID=1341695 RepID=A0A080N280_9BIFI|nr:L-threonylcarbamoyladenylate synthase [Bifidobacterium bombi]KFF31053.1 Sua5/YciO/YrdC family protein [Bifidobacterium bombi DSM 19703]